MNKSNVAENSIKKIWFGFYITLCGNCVPWFTHTNVLWLITGFNVTLYSCNKWILRCWHFSVFIFCLCNFYKYLIFLRFFMMFRFFSRENKVSAFHIILMIFMPVKYVSLVFVMLRFFLTANEWKILRV